jgi:hypothetical protein
MQYVPNFLGHFPIFYVFFDVLVEIRVFVKKKSIENMKMTKRLISS